MEADQPASSRRRVRWMSPDSTYCNSSPLRYRRTPAGRRAQTISY